LARLETHALPSIKRSDILSEETPWMQKRLTKKDDNAENETDPLDSDNKYNDDDDGDDGRAVEELRVASSISPTLDSCTEAMTALSPPSAKKISKAPVPSSLRMLYQPSFVTSASKSLSLPQPNLEYASTVFSLSDDDQHDQSDESSLCQDKTARPHASHKSHSSSSISISAKRPILWRRHQTMISSRGEFMKTLESSSIPNKKSLVFASDSYIPDPLREECQILPSTKFVTKPDDTTRRVSPETVCISCHSLRPNE